MIVWNRKLEKLRGSRIYGSEDVVGVVRPAVFHAFARYVETMRVHVRDRCLAEFPGCRSACNRMRWVEVIDKQNLQCLSRVPAVFFDHVSGSSQTGGVNTAKNAYMRKVGVPVPVWAVPETLNFRVLNPNRG
jgi:hypothetical protein